MEAKKRMIDADALKEQIQQYHDSLKPRYISKLVDAEIADIQDIIDEQPTVASDPAADLVAFAEDVAHQFGYYGQYNGRLHIMHMGLSTLEWAFDILGWENPHPAPEYECEIDGCHEYATIGTPTTDGYKYMCGKHYNEWREKDAKTD